MVPYDRAQAIGVLREGATVLSQDYADDGVHFRVRAPEALMERVRQLIDGPRRSSERT